MDIFTKLIKEVVLVMKKKLCAMLMTLTVAGCISSTAFASSDKAFEDVSTKDWAYDAINVLQQKDLIKGYPDGTFKGKQKMTREEMAAIIARLMIKSELEKADKSTVDRLSKQLEETNARVSALEEQNQMMLKVIYSMLDDRKK